MSQWYIMYNGQQVGPMEKHQLTAYGLAPNTMVWKEGMPQWAPAYTIPDLMQLIQQPRQQGYQQPSQPGYQQPGQPGVPPAGPQGAPKDHIVAGILAILLGGFGAQYFYMGKTNAGLISLGITFGSWILCFIIIGAFLLFAWGIILLVQGIMILCMSQQQFEQKYVNNPATFPLF